MVRSQRPVAALALVLALTVAGAGDVLGAGPEETLRRDRTVAVTIDDLPGPSAAMIRNDPATLAAMTRQLLAALAAHQVPAVGFVNAGKLEVDGEGEAERAARVDVLRLWTAAGLELGNHTYSHPSLNRTELPAFEADLERGEPVLRTLLAEHGRRLRYFRHPFLQVGLELSKRRAFEADLAARGYIVAPVTVDNDEYVFAAVYADARRRGDDERAARVSSDSLDYMDRVFAFVEAVGGRLLGREVAQTLLIHANTLNAETFDRLATRLERRGYRFVSLETALADPAYGLPDDYVGGWGISWLHHWELTAGRRRSPAPDPPAWIQQAYDALPTRY